MTSPYAVGATLTLQRHGLLEEIHARILQLYRPFTTSCVMRIRFQEGSEDPIEAVLKLYDRRFAHDLRKQLGVEKSSADSETAYRNSVRSGAATEFLKNTEVNVRTEGAVVRNPAEKEAVVHHTIEDMFGREVKAYGLLKNCQGAEIPALLGSVRLKKWSSSLEEIPAEYAGLLETQGLLLEHIPGTTFDRNFEHTLPRSAWQGVVDQAIRIPHIFFDHGILNQDVRLANIIATPDSSKECEYRAVMIDFGLVKFRDEYASDAAWGRANNQHNGEQYVGDEMKKRLKRQSGFELKFEPSNRYAQYASSDEVRHVFD